MNKKQITTSALLGLAVGDAFGVPYEFMHREEVRKRSTKNMEGCDTNPRDLGMWSECVPAGAWSDDTSMTIAAMDSIVDSGGNIDYCDIMRRFSLWWNKGDYTPFGFPFGLGGTCSRALTNYSKGVPALECGPKQITDNGNGSLMRILPFSLYCILNNLTMPETVKLIDNASSLTHGHEISKLGCLIFTVFLKELIERDNVREAWEAARKVNYSEYYPRTAINAYAGLRSPAFYDADDSCINESGYVVDTLTAAVYAMLHGSDYESSIMIALNLGYDTDTTCAITGALAGAFYGNIPERWLNRLLKRGWLETLADRFSACLT